MSAKFSSSNHKIMGIIVAIFCIFIGIYCSISLGVTTYHWKDIIDAYTAFDGSNEHLIIRTTRVPRALIAMVVGASLAIAGALMQALTRNPLASPSIFGVNAGAAFFIVIVVSYSALPTLQQLTWFAFLGAGLSAVVVYVLGSLGRDGMTPIKITLAGSAIAALFASLTQGILLTNGKTFDQILIWLVGSVAGRELSMLKAVFPYMGCALVLAMFLSRHVNILAMGEDVAKGLGQQILKIKVGMAVAIVLLAGGSVAVAGPIVFVGIIIPHIVRYLVGTDYRWIIPYCALIGALLLLAADTGARFISMPKEVPVGVLTAIIGVPFFVYIARRGGGA